MFLRSPLATALSAVLFLIACAAPYCQADRQAELLAEQEKAIAVDWEWVLIKTNSVKNVPRGFLGFGWADFYVTVDALVDGELPIDFGALPSAYDNFQVKWDVENPTWDRVGIVAYAEGSADGLSVVLYDKNQFWGDTLLIDQEIALPATFDEWVDVTLEQDGIKLNLSLRRSSTPLFTADDLADMNLVEELFTLENGEIASLAYKIHAAANIKAVLYFPGRNDSFAHPHVLAAYESMGYDFYTLDCRKCGRVRRFIPDTQYGHDSENFDEYREEIDLALDFIKGQKAYQSILTHCHSTGALIALNYAMLVGEESAIEPFDGWVLNAPFLEWGFTGSDIAKILLENAWLAQFFLGQDYIFRDSGLGQFHLTYWLTSRSDVIFARPIITPFVTANWANAVTTMFNKVLARKDPITNNPVLSITSLGDTVLRSEELVNRLKFIANDPEVVVLRFNRHDVTLSFTEEDNNNAISAIVTWLDSLPA